MNLSFCKLKKIFPKLNERELTLEDFYSVASEYQISIVEMRLKRRGYSLFDLETRQDFIFVKKDLDSLKMLETVYHEVCHSLISANETEANAFRLIALIPATKLDSYDWLEENPTKYAFKLWQERLRVRFLFGV